MYLDSHVRREMSDHLILPCSKFEFNNRLKNEPLKKEVFVFTWLFKAEF